MQLFYAPDIIADEYTLYEAESRHCINVLRLKNGDAIQLVDGKGGLYIAKIIDAQHRKCKVHITDKQNQFGKRNFYLHIVIAPTKQIERFEWFLEKATEIGIDEVTPIICHRSERKNINLDRLNKVIISAIKQSVKAYMPKLNDCILIEHFTNHNQGKNKFIAHCNEGNKDDLKNIFNPSMENVLIMIGPEGDFTKEEVYSANENDFISITLGQSRLRTETAGIVACNAANLFLQLK